MNPTQSNNANMRASFLKEMGITEWVDRSSSVAPVNSPVVPQGNPQASIEPTINASERAVEISGRWIFIGTKPQGDALILFQNIVRALGLPNGAWVWQDQKANIDALIESSTVPLVAIAFGAASAQRLTGENAPLQRWNWRKSWQGHKRSLYFGKICYSPALCCKAFKLLANKLTN